MKRWLRILCGIVCCLVMGVPALAQSSAQRGSLAGFAGRISASVDLLAAPARLGGARGLAANLARVSKRVK